MLDTTNFTLEDIKNIDTKRLKNLYTEYGSPKKNLIKQGAHLYTNPAPSKVRDSKWRDDLKPWATYPEKVQHVTIEQAYLYDIPKQLGAGNYVNLGVFRGGSTACLSFGIRDNLVDGKVYAVDLFQGHKSGGNTLSLLNKHFIDLKLSDFVVFCKGYTFELAKKLSQLNMTFNFIFIDANHEYTSCKLDFDLWYPMLKIGGIIAFHDSDFYSIDKFINDEVVHRSDLKELERVWSIRSFKRSK